MPATLNSTGVLYNDSTQQNTAWSGRRFQVFTSSGNFTVPTGITSLEVHCIAGGGGGGRNTNGGNGGYGAGIITGLTPGAVISVTVGSGGNGGQGSGGNLL